MKVSGSRQARGNAEESVSSVSSVFGAACADSIETRPLKNKAVATSSLTHHLNLEDCCCIIPGGYTSSLNARKLDRRPMSAPGIPVTQDVGPEK